MAAKCEPRVDSKPANSGTALASIDLAAIHEALGRDLGGVDPQLLPPSEVLRRFNATPLGEVISETALRHHCLHGGVRVGDGKTIDLLRYIAWLHRERQHALAGPEQALAGELTGYDTIKERSRERNLALSLSGRNIGELPKVVDQARKERCRLSLQDYCEEYFPHIFSLAWSKDHLRVIERIERAVLHGELFALAMPRGSGKTVMCEVACMWALVYAHHGFVVLVSHDESLAAASMDAIKFQFEANDLLLEDFPEVCYPIRCLEGINQRANGQLYRGQRTRIEWTANRIVLPAIPESKAAGGVIAVAGITGRIRGMKHTRADGAVARPSLVLIDDPQSNESAYSPTQCEMRERVIRGAIFGLAGPGKRIAGLAAVTVIRAGDLADRLLDRTKHPEWQGERCKMVYAMPKNLDLWDKYDSLWQKGMEQGEGFVEATEYYRQHRQEMDAGSIVAWPERYGEGEISALQNAMNTKARSVSEFWAEYQNEPLPLDQPDEELMTAEQIGAKVNGMVSKEVPIGVTHLTAFVDVHGKLLYWMVVGWEADYTGYIIDYGTEPEQTVDYFALRDARRTLATAAPKAGAEGAIYAGLERLSERLLGTEWRRDDSAMLRIERCLVDANWGQTTDLVYQFCRQSKYASVLLPSHGRYVGASSKPFSEYQKKHGDRVGSNWRIPLVTGRRAVRHITYDTNFWKSFVQARWAVAHGDPGCLSLYERSRRGKRVVVARHRLLCEHLTSEYRIRTAGRGRSVDEWRERANAVDNHWLDCLVGCAVAGSVCGATLPGLQQNRPKRQRVKLSELQKGRQRW